jgi:hypothetical protein
VGFHTLTKRVQTAVQIAQAGMAAFGLNARRKEIFATLHPEIKHGAPGVSR